MGQIWIFNGLKILFYSIEKSQKSHMFSSVTDTHRQQHVVADLDSASGADGPAVDDLGAYVPEQRLGPGEGFPRVSPHHKG